MNVGVEHKGSMDVTVDVREPNSRGKLCGEWVLCPTCGQKTRVRIRSDTILVNYPLYCPKCKQENLIQAKELQVTVIKEPDA